jgi:hypothetical protein
VAERRRRRIAAGTQWHPPGPFRSDWPPPAGPALKTAAEPAQLSVTIQRPLRCGPFH